MMQWLSSPTPAVRGSLYNALAGFFVLVGYEFTRSASNTLFKDAYGVQNLPIIMTMIPVGVLVVLFAYNKTLSRLGPRLTLQSCLLGGAVFFVIARFSIANGSKIAAAALFIVREAYIVLLIEQLWSYINSALTEQEAKVWNGIALSISTFGGALGGLGVYWLAERLGSLNLILIAAFLFLPTMYYVEKAYSICNTAELQSLQSHRNPSSETLRHQLGIDMFGQHPVLLLILFIVVSSQILSTVCTLNFQNALELYVPQSDQQTSLSGIFFSSLHVVSFLFQFFLVPLFMRRVEPRFIHMTIPLIHTICAVMVIVFPSLWTVGLALLCFKSLDYSFFRSAKEILYIPLPFDARFRSKELIDVLGNRASKGAISGSISVAQKIGVTLGTGAYGWCGLLASLMWFMWACKLVGKPTRVD